MIMSDDDMKKFRGVVKEELKQFRGVVKKEIKSVLEPVTYKLDALWDQVVKITEDLVGIKDTQELHTAALKTINAKEDKNKDDVGKLDKRLIEVEDNLGITPLPEHTVFR